MDHILQYSLSLILSGTFPFQHFIVLFCELSEDNKVREIKSRESDIVIFRNMSSRVRHSKKGCVTQSETEGVLVLK